MLSQKELIAKNDFDVLITIDAVRYDIFSQLYKKVFPNTGKLYEVKPCTFSSPPWFFENFTFKKPRLDIVFIAPDFELSSMNTRFMSWGYQLKYTRKPYNMLDFFGTVIDIWKNGYDKKVGVVRPETTANASIKAIKDYPDKKILVSFYQVHDPYIFLIEKYGAKVTDMEELDGDRPKYNRYHLRNLKEFSRYPLRDEQLWKIRKFLGKPPETGLGYLWLTFGGEKIKEAYRQDLLLTLSCCKKIVEEYPDKKIIITTDHPEYLGEGGMWGHGGKIPKGMNIPWLEICRKE